MHEETNQIPAEFTVIQSECGSWLLVVKPSESIDYDGFLDGVRSFLLEQTGMDDSVPESESEIN